MATKGDQNMLEVYKDKNVINFAYFHMHLLVLFCQWSIGAWSWNI